MAILTPINKAVVSRAGRMPVAPVVGAGKNGANVPARIGAPVVKTIQTRAKPFGK